MKPQTAKITWKRLVELEPGLLALYEYARSINDDKSKPSFCANALYIGFAEYRNVGLKGTLRDLVGWNRPDVPELNTSEAWDVAFEKIYNALPDCRNCLCG